MKKLYTKDTLWSILNDYENYIEYLEANQQSLSASLSREERSKEYWKNKFHELRRELTPEPIKRDLSTVRTRDRVNFEKVEHPTKEVKRETVKEVIKETKNTHKITKPNKITKESTAGNVKRSKHSGHMTKNDLLRGIFPNGEIKYFNKVNKAKAYVRKAIPELKDSALTNISAAARRSGFYATKDGYAYGVKWDYVTKDEVKK